jgi:hypothetical protein
VSSYFTSYWRLEFWIQLREISALVISLVPALAKGGEGADDPTGLFIAPAKDEIVLETKPLRLP